MEQRIINEHRVQAQLDTLQRGVTPNRASLPSRLETVIEEVEQD